MARIPPLPYDEVVNNNRDLLRKQFETLHSLPTAFRIMAYRPKLLEVISKMAEAIMLDELTISTELKWMVAHAVSSAVECRYCQAHTANYAVVTKSPVDKIKSIWNYENDPRFSPAERAAIRVAYAAGHIPSQVTDAMFDELKKFYSNEQIVDIVSVISQFGFFNRWNDTFATDLEDEPLKFGREHLENDKVGWNPGNHVPKKLALGD
jgi:uncharacterized peroxidase-related enzyme